MSWAIRLVMAPERKAVSRAAVSSTKSATSVMGDHGKLVIATVVALLALGFTVARDVVPLATVWRSAQVLAVRKSLGVKTMAEFVAYAKANPSKLTVGSAGIGAVTHLAIEVLKREAAIDLVHVPFRSTSESLPQLRQSFPWDCHAIRGH